MALGPRGAAGLCSASRAKRHSGSGPSAQTLGAGAGGVLSSQRLHRPRGLPMPFRRRCCLRSPRVRRHAQAAAVVLRGSCIHRGWRGPEFRPALTSGASALALQPAGPLQAPLCFAVSSITFGVCAGRSCHPPSGLRRSRLVSHVPSLTATPNPSLVGTATGKALGPRGALVYRPPRGPSAFPASAPQLKR